MTEPSELITQGSARECPPAMQHHALTDSLNVLACVLVREFLKLVHVLWRYIVLATQNDHGPKGYQVVRIATQRM